MRKCLDADSARNECFQYVVYLGIAAHFIDELLTNLGCICECIRRSGLKVTIHKCEFGLSEIQYLGSSIATRRTSLNCQKVEKLLYSFKMPKTPKQIRRFIEFFQFFRAVLPKFSERLLPFYTFLRNNQEIKYKQEHYDAIETLKRDLAKACDSALPLPKSGAQYTIMADAGFYAAGFVLMIEDYIEDRTGEPVKIHEEVWFGYKFFSPTHLKQSIHTKEFLAVHFPFDSFGHLLRESTEPTNVLTDDRSLTKFFQAKSFPANVWSGVGHVLNFKFIPGRTHSTESKTGL